MSYVISEVSLCNQALIELGSHTITSLTEKTTEAIACNAIFDNLRRELLALHPWNFATKQIELAQEVEAPLFDYSYKYSLPTDNLLLLKVHEDPQYRIQQNSIITNKASCKIEYVFDNTDVSTWTSSFVSVFVTALRFKLSYKLTGNGAEQERSYSIFKETLQKAKFNDASEDIQDQYGRYDNTLLGSRY